MRKNALQSPAHSTNLANVNIVINVYVAQILTHDPSYIESRRELNVFQLHNVLASPF